MQEVLQGDMYEDILDIILKLLVSLQPHFEEFLKVKQAKKLKTFRQFEIPQ